MTLTIHPSACRIAQDMAAQRFTAVQQLRVEQVVLGSGSFRFRIARES